MIFDISYTEALRIQRAQLAYYRQAIGLKGVRKIKRNTLPCPEGIHPDTPISIFTINKLIPRGGDIEYLIQRKYRHRDPLNEFVHNAIRRGLM